MISPVCILTVAGSDSGGGAGVQVDQRTIRAIGGHALTAVTAVTAQDTLGVSAWEPVSAALVRAQVESALSESGIRDGLCLVNAMHISSSVFINDDESGLHADFEKWLEKLAPEKPHSQYAHNRGEDNADAHLTRTIMGREVVVAVTDGGLDFGPWEQIFYGEFDGLRRKRVLVKIIGQ